MFRQNNPIPIHHLLAAALFPFATGASCAPATPQPPPRPDAAIGRDLQPASAVTHSNANVGLLPDHTPTGDPNFAEIEGVVTAAPHDRRTFDGHEAFFSSSPYPMHALTIRTDLGREWTLGYEIVRHEAADDVTPNLRYLLGERVKLRFRVIRAFGSTAGFVLSTDAGVAFALASRSTGIPCSPKMFPD